MTRPTRLVSTAAAIGSAAVLVFSSPAFAGGATDPGYYTDDCKTSACAPSENGNGNGKAVKRPDAGSVGNADVKNPKGQQPNESDGNNGYECEDDINKGIAKGNPAHSGCEVENPV